MFVVRSLTIVEDGVLSGQVRRVWIQPCVDVLGFDRNDAAIEAGGGHLGRWIIGYRGERQKFWLATVGPARPQACDQHVLLGPRSEFEDDIFLFLIRR
jgi:hypothetical protein